MPLGSRNSAFVLGIFVALVLIVTSMNAVVQQSRNQGAIGDDFTETHVDGSEGSEDGWVYTPECGDGYGDIDAGEECDDGNLINGDGCDQNCAVEETDQGDYVPVCGDGLPDADAGEECDDGNMENGDGCDVGCKFEDGWTEESSEAASEEFVESSEAASSEEMNSEGSSESSSVQQSSMQTSSASSTTSSAHSSSRSAQECSSGYRCDVEPGAGGGGTCGHLQICPAGERPEVFGTCTELCSAYSAYMPILMDGECYRCVPYEASSSSASSAPASSLPSSSSSAVSSSRSSASSSRSVCAACEEVCAVTATQPSIDVSTETQESLWQDFLDYLFGRAPTASRTLTAQVNGGDEPPAPFCTSQGGVLCQEELTNPRWYPFCQLWCAFILPPPDFPLAKCENGTPVCVKDYWVWDGPGQGHRVHEVAGTPTCFDKGPDSCCNDGQCTQASGTYCQPASCGTGGAFYGASGVAECNATCGQSSSSSSSVDECQQCIAEFCASSSSAKSSSKASSQSSSSSEGPCETDPDEPNACTLGGNSFCIDQGLGCVLIDDLPCAMCEGLCGNHELDEEEGEQCDDGNTKDDDGCSSTCEIEDIFCGLSSSSPAESSASSRIDCTDTDNGQDPTIQGTVETWYGSSNTDYCLPPRQGMTVSVDLKEFSCHTGAMAEVEMRCAQGTHCEDGACVDGESWDLGDPENACTDTDGGFVIDVQGTVTFNFGGQTITDHCNGDALTEYFCSSTLEQSTIFCPNGCSDGACLP